MSRFALIEITEARKARGLVDLLERRFVDLEGEFITEAARFLGRDDIIDLWLRDRAGAERMLRDALDEAARGVMAGAAGPFAEGWEAFMAAQLDRVDRVGAAALEAGLGAVKAPPLAASRAGAALELRYKSVWHVVDRLVLTGREDVVARLEKGLTDAATGADSIDGAIRSCMDDLARDGVTGHVYPSGRRISLSPYVRRELITNVMNATHELTFDRAADWGTDLIQVSAHAGARPLCFPFQGGVYSLKGGHPKYKALADTSYGEPAGLFGINCRHFSWPFFEGMNDEYTAAQKDPALLLNGPSNSDVYEATQTQRYNERQIRRWKRKGAELAGLGLDPSWAEAKVRQWQGRQRAFIRTSQGGNIDLRRDYLRERA
jgi:hypothetical protein